MNPALQTFLASRVPFPGLAAMGVRTANHALVTQSYCDWLPISHADQALELLAPTAGALPGHQIEPLRLCWVFEHLRIHLALRRDGASLALFVENGPTTSQTAVETAITDFVALEFNPPLQ